MEMEIHLEPGRQGSLPQSATASTPASAATFGVPPDFVDTSGQIAVPPAASNMNPSGLADDETADAFDSKYDGLYSPAQSSVPPMPGAQVPASSGLGASSRGAPSEN